MSMLKQIKRGPIERPHFIGLYGVGGIGKTTMAAGAPAPVFLGTDDGFATLDVASLPIAQTWVDINAQVDALLSEEHEFKTAVFDTINGLEPLLWAHLCKTNRCNSIEEIGGGFGKGYVLANEHWVEWWKKLKRLRMKMHVICLGHAMVKTVNDVIQGESYDRYLLKMHDKAALLFHEAVDCMFFANFEVDFRKEKGAKKAKAYGEGKRVMFSEERPWFMAKSRFDLPFEMDLSWDDFATRAASCKPKASGDEFLKVFAGMEADATAYLVNIGWLVEGQALGDLKEAQRKPIINKADDFRKAVTKYVTDKNQPETTPADE